MDIESRLPFGLHQASGELVDVASVPRGRNCACICPSCHTPLVARQGELKEWHFAHQSRSVHQETRKECEYSFEVSVRLMIRQLSMNGLKFRTPKYMDSLTVHSDISHHDHTLVFVITESCDIQLDKPLVGEVFSEVEVDVVGDVENIPFVIYITYQGRNVPSSLKSPAISKCGVVEVNLLGLRQRFKQQKYGQYIDALKHYIEGSTEGKSWVYHPRFIALQQKAKAEIDLWLDRQEPLAHYSKGYKNNSFNINLSKVERPEITKPIEKHYKCIMCSSQWFGASFKCKRCNTHLFTTEVKK